VSIRSVADAWMLGQASKSGNVSTDGQTIWSWRLAIGETRRGVKVAIDHRGQVTGSTSRHCGVVIDVADVVVQWGEP